MALTHLGPNGKIDRPTSAADRAGGTVFRCRTYGFPDLALTKRFEPDRLLATLQAALAIKSQRPPAS